MRFICTTDCDQIAISHYFAVRKLLSRANEAHLHDSACLSVFLSCDHAAMAGQILLSVLLVEGIQINILCTESLCVTGQLHGKFKFEGSFTGIFGTIFCSADSDSGNRVLLKSMPLKGFEWKAESKSRNNLKISI